MVKKLKKILMSTTEQTYSQLKLLSVISGLSVTEIITQFAKIVTPLSIKNKAEVFGCELQFKLKLEENAMLVKLKPKGFDKE